MVRITTWNVNGIRSQCGPLKSLRRNPFGYQPWRDKRSFAAMFDLLEADIVVFQETKIQRKDLNDDMVLVPGWDCYWSLPKHKKGYSGVVVYTRQSVCAPIRAEEGITGALLPPNSPICFSELPKDQQIGGYPTSTQLENSAVDAITLDSEGRCVILEFPAFVLLGVYSPANRDETRDEFRHGFLTVLDARIRNLTAIGKRVFLTGDLNISRNELDTANAAATMRKIGYSAQEYISTPARRMFNHLVEDGKVVGQKDKGREAPILWDICRGFHPKRQGMFTCWEQKVNARPGNYGARIDYVLCSLSMKTWFLDSNIQEGLMGSDHCPVFAVMRDLLDVEGQKMHVLDAMNPPGMFLNGKRVREYCSKDMLPMSGKLIPEFEGRRNIRDMFARKPSLAKYQITNSPDPENKTDAARGTSCQAQLIEQALENLPTKRSAGSPQKKKRSISGPTPNNSLKRTKIGADSNNLSTIAGSQQSLKGFFKPRATASPINISSAVSHLVSLEEDLLSWDREPTVSVKKVGVQSGVTDGNMKSDSANKGTNVGMAKVAMDPSGSTLVPMLCSASMRKDEALQAETVHDPVQSKEHWSKIFTKPVAPQCEGHDEPCKTMLTKKSGMNCGRSFWMCARPLGPSGDKEKNTQWRCHTFIWCSDWNPGLLA